MIMEPCALTRTGLEAVVVFIFTTSVVVVTAGLNKAIIRASEAASYIGGVYCFNYLAEMLNSLFSYLAMVLLW